MAEVSPQTGLLGLASSLLAGGGVKYLADWLRDRAAKKDAAPQETYDANMLSVVRSRDELEDDNARLRQTLQEERAQHASERAVDRAQHAADRAEWTAERSGLRAEIDALQERLRSLLEELADLRERHHI